MPRYCYTCDQCETHAELERPMAAASDPIFCTCGLQMRRDYRAERPRGHGYQAWESERMGVPECVIAKAEHVRRRDGGHDSFIRQRVTEPDGRVRVKRVQINQPGTTLNPRTGNVLVPTRAHKRDAVRRHGMVEFG